MIQRTDWGEINWIHAGNKEDLKQSLNVGITYLGPGSIQPKHIHYGLEQFLYILEGEGYYIINGEKKEFTKGDYFYLKVDSSHETINTGIEPIRELMITHPVNYNSEIEIEEDLFEDIDLDMNNILYAAVEAIRTQLLESISLPFTIYDEMWSIVIQNNNFSNYCRENCGSMEETDRYDCMNQRDFEDLSSLEGTQFICKYGLTIFHYPIIYNGKSLGSIRGGHILISNSHIEHDENLYDSPRSTIMSIHNLLKQIVKSLLDYCIFNSSRQLLEEKDKAIREVTQSNQILEKNLYVINDKVTNLRINHHFLFNTLNSLASMSLVGDRYHIYNAIIDLSKMFRYTMAVDLKFVSLSSEMEYLETYLNLQRLRYVKDLEVFYDIEDKLENTLVPFNSLQPIVENAFTHGFSPSDEKKIIRIDIEKIENRARIAILNNGVPLNNLTINRINKSLGNNTGHGLSLIYEKFKSAYGTEFDMEMVSDKKEGTGVILDIPITYEVDKQ